MKNLIASLLCGVLCAGLNTHTLADTLAVPIGQQGSEQNIQRPAKGITKSQVKNQFGEPNGWRPAVGEPPISSWVYNGFTVYFEYDRVIHSVLTR